MADVEDSAEEIAAKLTEAQRDRLLTFRQEPSQLGIGMRQFLPGLVQQDGADHPIFGPHYRLTPLGLEVRQVLERLSNQPPTTMGGESHG